MMLNSYPSGDYATDIHTHKDIARNWTSPLFYLFRGGEKNKWILGREFDTLGFGAGPACCYHVLVEFLVVLRCPYGERSARSQPVSWDVSTSPVNAAG